MLKGLHTIHKQYTSIVYLCRSDQGSCKRLQTALGSLLFIFNRKISPETDKPVPITQQTKGMMKYNVQD